MRGRARKSSGKWLSIEAVTAKRQRRQLERKRNRSEIDRQAYRVACRHTNRLINQSCSDHIRSELEACSDPRQRWTVAKRLLRADNYDDIALCEQFSDFFKIEQLRHRMVCQLSDSPFSQPLPPEPTHTGPQLNTLPAVTTSNSSSVRASVRANLIHKCFISRDVFTLICAFKIYVRHILK